MSPKRSISCLENINTKSSDLPRIALVIDSENWAFHNYAKQISKHLSGSYHFQIFASANYENPALLMLDVQDFDLIHFFWRADLYRLLDEWTQRFFLEKGWDYQGFIKNVVAKANITTSVYDHLFLSESEIEERKVLFNALSVGYTTVSQRLLQKYSSISFYPDAYGAIEDGVDLEFFTPMNLQRLADPNKEIVVGWVGNSKWGGDGIDHKGIETIIKPAVESLREEGYNLRGFYADRQERWIPHSEMNHYYNSIDIYVCASDIEGKPDPVLESMACGLPIISTDVGIVPQLFGPLQKNYILPTRSIQDLKAKLKELIESPQERELLSKENLERIQKWSWENQSQKWDHFFKENLIHSNDSPKSRVNLLRGQNLELLLNTKLEKENKYNLQELETRLAEKDRWAKELESAVQELETRFAEKDRWAKELESAVQELETRFAEKDRWAKELESAVQELETRLALKVDLIQKLEFELVQRNEEKTIAKNLLDQKQSELEVISVNLEHTQKDLQSLTDTLISIKSSNFWKVRDSYLKAKNLIRRVK